MPLPKLDVGRVIEYSYLWKRQERAGLDEGQKDRRPCVIIAAIKQEDGTTKAYVMPISHTAPEKGTPAIEIPRKVKQHLGMDGGRSWVFYGELNKFNWPGFDVQPMAGGREGYGLLPPEFFKTVRDAAKELSDQRKLKFVNRDFELKRG